MVTTRNVERAHAALEEEYGQPPWSCYGCGDAVEGYGRARYAGHAHHVDKDKSNDVAGNVVPMHNVCHQRLHHPDIGAKAMLGKKHSDEAKAKMSSTRRGGPGNPGYKHTDETKQRVREKMIGIKRDPEQFQRAWETRRARYGETGRR